MPKSHLSKTILCGAAIVATTSIAAADTLSASRIDAINAAFDEVLTDPELNVDGFSPARMSLITAAYATHDAEPDTDRLQLARWVEMKRAYATHDPKRIVLAAQ